MFKMLGLVTPTRLKSPDLIAEARTEVDTLNYSTVSHGMHSCKRPHLYTEPMAFAKTQGCMQEVRCISFLLYEGEHFMSLIKSINPKKGTN